MLRRILPLVVVVLSLSPLRATEPKPTGNVVLMESSDVDHPIALNRFSNAMQLMAREMKVDLQHLPRVMVVHVTSAGVKALGYEKTPLNRNVGQRGGVQYYELWVVDEPVGREWLSKLESIIEDHFGLHYSAEQRNQFIRRAALLTEATVDAKDYAGK